MTALGIRYLTGNSVAADVTEESSPEWPPHPARVFMAMVAAHFETGSDANERQALLWLEQQPPPAICASEEQRRSVVEVFVAVNDEAGVGMARSRQPRTFPSCRPDRDTVWLQYSNDVPNDLAEALSSLCRKVTRIGHSSSMVQMWISDSAIEEPTWQPKSSGRVRFRVPEEGVLELLEKSFNGTSIEQYWELKEKLEGAKGKEAKVLKEELAKRFCDTVPLTTRPQLSSWAAYERIGSTPQPATIHDGPYSDELLILSRDMEGPNLGIETSLALTGALRNALLKLHGKACPAWVSGHEENGERTMKPHLAFFPLPFVGEPYGDGHLLGVGIAVPRGVDAAEMRKFLGPFLYDESGDLRNIKLWKSGDPPWEWKVQLSAENTAKTLRTETWTKPSEIWASVTPVVLHHYPDKRKSEDVERILREAFKSAGLPDAAELRVRSASIFRGAGHANSMPKLEQEGVTLTRFQTHVMVRFAGPVRGPVLLGRGRFRGYGLMRPIDLKEWKLWS